jgi:ParB family chromosome partitioning protein
LKEQIIERIPIAGIRIANPRARSRGRWQMIVANIREVGLKKPITVVRRFEPDAEGKLFDLVCGKGELRRFSLSAKRPFQRWSPRLPEKTNSS